jgi:hypothetical protein
MSERREDVENAATSSDARGLMREVIEEYLKGAAAKTEPAYKNELAEERKRREHLERKLNELVEENARSRKRAEEAERHSAIRAELQRLGVVKVELAFKAVKDEIQRSEDGRLVAMGERGDMTLRDYLTHFVNENPEVLPARNLGGSGATAGSKTPLPDAPAVELEKIRPGMSAEELERARREIARIASQSLYAG